MRSSDSMMSSRASGDAARAWTLTRPDRTQFLFDADGYQSATRDKNGNELLFTYDNRKSNNKPIKFLKYLTDAAEITVKNRTTTSANTVQPRRPPIVPSAIGPPPHGPAPHC